MFASASVTLAWAIPSSLTTIGFVLGAGWKLATMLTSLHSTVDTVAKTLDDRGEMFDQMNVKLDHLHECVESLKQSNANARTRRRRFRPWST